MSKRKFVSKLCSSFAKECLGVGKQIDHVDFWSGQVIQWGDKADSSADGSIDSARFHANAKQTSRILDKHVKKRER